MVVMRMTMMMLSVQMRMMMTMMVFAPTRTVRMRVAGINKSRS